MTHKFILMLNDEKISEHDIDKEATIIGRGEQADIRLDHRAVSGKHARIIRVGNKCIIEDLGSTNGTFINSRKMPKHLLQHGETIQIGNYMLRFSHDGQESKQKPEPEMDSDKTMIIQPPSQAKERSKAEKDMPLGAIQMLSGPLTGKSYELVNSLTNIGKGDQCRIKVKGFTVGKQAAVITRRHTGYQITRLEGMSKTRVNGTALGEQQHLLADGDIIELGDIKMQFFIK
ncbi:MAG: FHA domain-containing protein [Mariprofundaceae bacterium]|nr:FHA domain-containing protein [Mariprofundaceae bacterium]